MRYKTLFGLGVKWVGLCAVVIGAILFVERLFFLGWTYSGSVIVDLSTAERLLSPSTSILIGLYLFFRGEWIVSLAIPSNRPYCPECGFDLSKHRGAICPECGTHIPAEIARQLDEYRSSADDDGDVSARTPTEET